MTTNHILQQSAEVFRETLGKLRKFKMRTLMNSLKLLETHMNLENMISEWSSQILENLGKA